MYMYVTYIREVKDIEQEYDFIEKPPNDFFCPIMDDLLLDPYQTACCGNHLSSEAASRLQEEKRGCPICRKKILIVTLDQHFRRRVYQLRVFCCHKKRGCGWKGELFDLEQHIQTCPRKNSPVVKDLPLCECLQYPNLCFEYTR